MIWFSWAKRIARAEQLADDYPASAEILRFYAQVTRFQQDVYERLKPRAESRALPPDVLDPDLPKLLRLVQRIGPAALAQSAAELDRANRSVEFLARDEAREDLLFFRRVLLQPLMECMAKPEGAAAVGAAARCPSCGEWPQAAVLRGEGDGAKRWLACSLCSREWEFRRMLCPACGEEDPHLLPIYTSEDFRHVRVEACDRCHAYLKSVDLTRDGLAIPCVDELAAVPLDLWAGEAGYRKVQRNLLGL